MLDTKETAVVMIEFQNDFTTEGGALHGAVKDVMESTDMLRNAQETVAKAREMGATIIHAPITFAEGYPELGDHPYGILKGVVDTESFRKGTWGADFADEMKPANFYGGINVMLNLDRLFHGKKYEGLRVKQRGGAE